jgi:outer membrane protein OmpA-like peptidoglycan-associated protein
MKKVTLLLLSLAFGLAVAAQESNTGDDSNQDQKEEKEKEEKETTRKYRTWSVGADFGWSMLIGDFYFLEANKRDFNDEYGNFDPGVTLNLQKWYSSAWGWRGRMGWRSYSGTRGIYAFKASSAFQGDLAVQLNLSGLGNRNRRKPRKDALLVSAGIGYSWANASVFKNGEEIFKLGNDNRPEFISDSERDEKSHNTVYMPFGIEYRYRIATRWDLKFAIDGLWALDDNYEGSRTAVKDEVGQGLSNPDVVDLAFGNTTNDYMLYFNIGANFHFSFMDHDDPTPIIYVGPGTDPRVDTLVEQMDQIMTDNDNDGVSDYFDKEPDTPEGYMVYGGGQAVDQDKDGIPDDIDEDPYSTPGERVDANGRELDDDGDGVPNGRDLEPNTEGGAFVNFQGVTIVDKVGGGSGTMDVFLPTVYFDFNKTNISKANYQRLGTVSRFLDANPDVKLILVGHTDKVGSEPYNQGLSMRRAESTKKALVNDFGVDESRLITEGKGKTMLMTKRNDINRRVEFQIQQ